MDPAPSPFFLSAMSPILPCEILDIIAGNLIADDAFGSCANLNMTSHAVYGATLKTLWTFMCWSTEYDLAEYSADEIEAKWEVIQGSAGAKYIRYMVEPHITNPSGVFQRRPVISETLAKTLKASVKVNSHRHGGPDVHVHLFDNYGYGKIDMQVVQRALDLVRAGPRSKQVVALEIFLRHGTASLQQSENGPTENDPSETAPMVNTGHSSNRQVEQNVDHLLPSHMIPDPRVSAELRSVHVWLDTQTKIAGPHDQVLWTNILLLLLPYALKHAGDRNGIGRRATFGMVQVPPSVLISIMAAYATLCEADEIFSTFDVKLSTSPDTLNISQVIQLRTLMNLMANNSIHAAEYMPLRLLGSLHASSAPRAGARLMASVAHHVFPPSMPLCVDIRADITNKQLSTRFIYGFPGEESRFQRFDSLSEVGEVEHEAETDVAMSDSSEESYGIRAMMDAEY